MQIIGRIGHGLSIGDLPRHWTSALEVMDTFPDFLDRKSDTRRDAMRCTYERNSFGATRFQKVKPNAAQFLGCRSDSGRNGFRRWVGKNKTCRFYELTS